MEDRILLAIHGHRHDRYSMREIHKIQYMAHPFGYPHQHRNVEDGLAVVSLEVR